MKGLRIDQFRPLVFIQTLYWGVAFYQLYYACVLPKLIVGSVGFIIGYFMVIHIINRCLFTEIGVKPFYTAMCFIVAGVSLVGHRSF